MHLLKNDSALDKLPLSQVHQASSVPRILDAAQAMDHLDALEAQSIYILREAFARLKKLALLWSLGKDSNVMIWLARKAFFGKVPFPALHVDTGKKFPEMYAFRDTYAKQWGSTSRSSPARPLMRSIRPCRRPRGQPRARPKV